MKTVISLKCVSKGFADGERVRPVLDEFDLEIARGETVALCGPSGSGKSTVLNLIAGLLCVDAGQLVLDLGEEHVHLERLSEKARARVRRRYFGFVFQFFNLVPTLTIAENVCLPLELNAMQERRDEALARIQRLGLSDRLDDFPEQLSGGEQQRVAVARALAHKPPILLADEPTGNLDTDTGEAVTDMLWGEVAQEKCTLVVATHSSAVAARADRIVTLGRL
ncbi:MAG: ABC transporter ATP-binding protein [Pseudomonadales bacterium]|jgi:putative ABC transport system ATP-binding protein|nr:ABC transporter ATP-binding protein [Pseudomonadales bacterium]MDP6470927.1 ABC transporter ATP-binding protein [Pseudomonadales bacterium]MDP6825888.1 ABC transporter ATP-binding protein [Pseudomonadales bacterium]MDP6972856.1 ABC transporter ATP-binding protein [Pseudomonadales bacterium]|tara:strand:+ start:417 stop:1085 length:669 start_codon:yes stop_codon:yes gene_type:complete